MTRSPRAMTELYQRFSARAGAIGVVKGGHEVAAGGARRRPGAPRRGAAAGMDDVDAEPPDDADQRRRVAAHDQRVLRGQRQCQVGGAAAGEVAFDRAAGRGDIGVPAGRDERRRQFDGAALGPARNQARDDLQNRRRAAFWRRSSGRRSSGGRSSASRSMMLSSPSLPPGRKPAMNPPQFLSRPDGATIAYHRLAGAAPGIVFLAGSRSDMTRHQGAVSRGLLPAARARLCAVRLFRPRRVERRFRSTARSAAGPRTRSRSSIS